MNKRKEIFSIPNILSYFRIILIPFFTFFYITAKNVNDYYIAAAIIAVSGLTDLFDGRIARHFNMITELGIFIDPVADKLTQAAVFICFLIRFNGLMWILFSIFAIKESFMGVMGIVTIKHNRRKLDGAKWFGKVSTATLYIIIFTILIFPMMSTNIINVFIIICSVVLLTAFILYIPVFIKLYKQDKI